MRSRRSVPFLAAVTLAVSLRAAPVRTEALPIEVETRTLANGMRVVLSPDHSARTVAVAVYYDVGARNEVRGRSGFAHLFEHMMFEGSANVPKGEHFRLISQHGGDFNGTTSEDRTNYYETLPSNALALGLWLEADRMRSLQVTPEHFENQRETVLEERRQSYENEPYMLSILARDALAYGDYFPYAHSVIGDPEDLRRATFEDVAAFHTAYYAPNNAVLSLAGDFQTDAAMRLVEQYFATIPRAATPAFTEPAFPEQTAPRNGSVQDAHAPLPGFHMVWHIPPRRTPDHYALELLAIVLGDGDSARLYRELVKEREVASSIEVNTEDRRGPDLFTLWCVLASDHTLAEVRALVDRALQRVIAGGPESITGRELAKAKNRVRSAFVFGLQSNLHRALQLGEFELYDGNATLLRTELDRYLSVQLDDLRRVAARYLVDAHRTVLEVVPAPAPAAAEGGAR